MIITLFHVASLIAIHQIINITAEGSNHNQSLCLFMTFNKSSVKQSTSTLDTTPSSCDFWEMCECQGDELNVDDAAARDRLHPSLTRGSICHPQSLLHYFPLSFPFNSCRQGRHQSEWQVVWSSSRTWWEKEHCQHKYPSCICCGRSAAGATVMLRSWSPAEKQESRPLTRKYMKKISMSYYNQCSSCEKHEEWYLPAVCSWLYTVVFFYTEVRILSYFQFTEE